MGGLSLSAITWMKSFIDRKPVSRQCYLICLTILCFLIIGYFFITWPIVAYDTDLWYHLSGGRYFFENHHIADNSYFSFLTPVKNWYNYYWFFQIITFTIFSQAGYYGLVLLRCMLFLVTACFIYLQLIQKDEDNAKIIFSAFFFITAVIALTQRELLVRPHLFSYLFISVFLYLLEKKKNILWLLPILGILWCNIHGIEYPVMILIVLAYLAEFFWQNWKNGRGKSGAKYVNWFLIITCYTIFFTPGITALLSTPFEVSCVGGQLQYLYIEELKPLPWERIFTISFVPFSNLIGSLQNIYLLATVPMFLICLYKRNLRISHFILFIGSVALLSQYNRFVYEFILLSIPMNRQGILLFSRLYPAKRAASSHILLPVILVVIPLITYTTFFKFRPQYPLSETNLPTGSVAFLNHVNVGGKVLNDPNTGGYLHWSLNRNYKIAMDLQMAIFSDEDYANVIYSFYDENAFKRSIKKYDPSFITISVNRRPFIDVISHQDNFVPVFLDNSEILYVNQEHYRNLADKYRLKDIEPFNIQNLDIEKMSEQQRTSIYDEALKMLQIDKTNDIANWLAGNIMIIRGDYQRALTHADILIRNQPEMPAGYALKADAFREMEYYSEASRFYIMAIKRGPMFNMKKVYRNLVVVYNKLHEYKKAYKFFSRIVNPFSSNSYKDIFELSMSAAAAGKQKDAIMFLKIALLKVPLEDSEYKKKINDMLSTLMHS